MSHGEWGKGGVVRIGSLEEYLKHCKLNRLLYRVYIISTSDVLYRLAYMPTGYRLCPSKSVFSLVPSSPCITLSPSAWVSTFS